MNTNEPCEHATVDLSLYKPRRWRRFNSYREWCLDCDATRCREFNRFRWGKWSPWALSTTPEERDDS